MILTEVKRMIVDFGINQSEITKAANTRRGVSRRAEREERKLITQLLGAITGSTPKREDVDDVIKQLG